MVVIAGAVVFTVDAELPRVLDTVDAELPEVLLGIVGQVTGAPVGPSKILQVWNFYYFYYFSLLLKEQV